MTTTISMLTGTCSCGADVAKEQAEGFGADILNNLPFVCPECSVERETAS